MKKLLRKTDADAVEAQVEAHARVKLRKLILWGGVAAAIFFVIAWIGWSYVSDWRQGRDLRKAQAYEQAGDYRRALLTLEQTVQIYPLNMEAKRSLAGFYDRASQPQALQVWNEVAKAEPANAKNWLGLATTAVRFLDQRTAQRALSKLEAMNYTGDDYYRLAAATAMLTGDTETIETSLVALAKARPEDYRVQMSLAVLRLKSADKAKNAAGAAALLELVRHDALRLRIVLELLSDVARRWPSPTPEREAALNALAAKLTPAEGPRIDQATSTAVDRLVEFAEAQPQPLAEDVGVFLRWMATNGWSGKALLWTDTLDPKTLASPWVKPLLADAALEVRDWTRLRALIVDGAWGPMPVEAFDRALALRKRSGKNPPSTHQEWNDITELCHSSLPGLRMLARLSKLWQWPQEKQQVLQTITRDFPRESWAWRELVADALARRDSDLLWRTYYNRSLAMPGDTGMLIEASMVGLLTDQRNAPTVAVAEDIVRREPKNNGAKIVHALALWRAKRWVEALAILEALPPAVFSEPRYALVYGLVLSEANRPKESQQMLDWASAERLLPEESLLVEQARARNVTRLR